MKPQSFPRQICPTLDNSFWRRAEARLNVITGIALGGFVLWLAWEIAAAIAGGAR